MEVGVETNLYYTMISVTFWVKMAVQTTLHLMKLALCGTKVVCANTELKLRDEKKLVLPFKLKYITFYVLAPVSLFIPILTGLHEGTRSKQT